MREHPRILFLTSSINYPAFNKRINALSDDTMSSLVLGFERNFEYPTKDVQISTVSLGKIQNGNYWKRLFLILKAIRKTAEIVGNYDTVYCFGLDMAMLAVISTLFSPTKTLVYEVQDIRPTQTNKGLISGIVRKIEKIIVNISDCVVVTSQDYICQYYENILRLKTENFIVIENKLSHAPARQNITNFDNTTNVEQHLTIGYFGSIRCEKAWQYLLQLCEKNPHKIKLKIHGAPSGIDNFDERLSKHSNIQYLGPFLDPEQLEEVYSSVDVVWAAGFHGKASYAWSRSCRFYNAGYFNKPIISQDLTSEGKVVKNLDIGLTIDISDPASMKKIEDISHQNLKTWKRNLAALPQDMFIHNGEHKRLIEMIRENHEHNREARSRKTIQNTSFKARN
ncbi:hypothetical protein OPS25_12025 [Alteromonas ponticola]|uniref:Glycosyltransferase family 4 protein n=1 Tax=Alteromonas aquimaris TaxID=2998417 RepID=A0ABT3P8X3_9ALTE|nr:hypothetical protein [Alteromonas aquimaris]MCW8109226.1 hypothetical protein [Alteromonas aquimaris]